MPRQRAKQDNGSGPLPVSVITGLEIPELSLNASEEEIFAALARLEEIQKEIGLKMLSLKDKIDSMQIRIDGKPAIAPLDDAAAITASSEIRETLGTAGKGMTTREDICLTDL